jgi:DNA replication protein
MKKFDGFPYSKNYAPVPLAFFSELLPDITDINELKATLYMFKLLIPMRRQLQFVTLSELAGDINLVQSLKVGDEKTSEALKRTLDMAVKRGTFLQLSLDKNGNQEDIYLLNNRKNQEIVEKIKSGELSLPRLEVKQTVELQTRPQSNIFSLYEENIGLISPMIAEDLKEAEKLYPKSLIYDAFKEAVKANKRNWRFIEFLLERWATEGKTDGTHKRNFKATDPDKYFKDRYGDHFQR